MEEATANQGNYKSKHAYTLEEFGLSKEWINEELGPLLDPLLAAEIKLVTQTTSQPIRPESPEGHMQQAQQNQQQSIPHHRR